MQPTPHFFEALALYFGLKPFFLRCLFAFSDPGDCPIRKITDTGLSQNHSKPFKTIQNHSKQIYIYIYIHTYIHIHIHTYYYICGDEQLFPFLGMNIHHNHQGFDSHIVPFGHCCSSKWDIFRGLSQVSSYLLPLAGLVGLGRCRSRPVGHFNLDMKRIFLLSIPKVDHSS